MRNVLHKGVLSAMIMAYAVGQFATVYDSVVCLDADGHAHIEMAINGKCCPVLAPSTDPVSFPDRVASLPSPTHSVQCDNCVDIPLQSGPASFTPKDAGDGTPSIHIAARGQSVGLASGDLASCGALLDGNTLSYSTLATTNAPLRI